MTSAASPPRRGLSSMVATGVRSLTTTLDGYRSRHSHLVVETPDGQSGFALFGGTKARHQFQRLYLGTTERLPVRAVFHRTATADDCRALARKYGLVVFCGDSAPSALASELLSIPVFADMEMPAPAVLEGPGARWSVSIKNNLSRIRRGRFEYDTQSGDAGVAEFHSRMFQPTMLSRHGAEAYVASRRQLTRFAREAGSELLRVFQDGKWVAASLNQSVVGGYRLHKLGWADGDPTLLRSGVVSAVYWFNIKRAAALGAPRVLFGSVLPFLDDGLLRYKSFWGGHLSANGRGYGTFRLLLEPSHPTCRRFLQSHSLVTRGPEGDFIVFSGGTPETVATSHALLASLSRWYTWRDQRSAEPEVRSEEVPLLLRPWLSVRSLAVTPRPD